jgi:outer membrane protein OmpA-like peptidoglycan-associated protein
MINIKTLTLIAMVSLTSGCMTYDPYTGEQEVSSSTTGAIAGAVAGALIGVATSSKSDRGKGALIGAIGGGAIGGGVGYYMDTQEAKLRHQLLDSGVSVSRSGNEILLIMPGNITFETGKANLQPSFEEIIRSVSLVLKEFDKTAIDITGHTDSTGSLAMVSFQVEFILQAKAHAFQWRLIILLTENKLIVA